MYVSIPSWAFVPVASVEQQLMNTTYLEIAFWEAEVEAHCFATTLYPAATTK